MKDEIKEILDNFKIYEDRYKKCNETQFIITYREIQILLDYITNLQEKNKKLKELCDKYEEEHSTTFQIWKYNKDIYKSRNEKIINKISLYRMDDITMETNRILDDLLNTARGVDKE